MKHASNYRLVLYLVICLFSEFILLRTLTFLSLPINLFFEGSSDSIMRSIFIIRFALIALLSFGAGAYFAFGINKMFKDTVINPPLSKSQSVMFRIIFGVLSLFIFIVFSFWFYQTNFFLI